MFDIGWSEMAVIAVVALVVLGPKELPNALKAAAHWMRTARKMAREFQSGVDQIVREAELDEARKTVQQATQLNLGQEFEKVVDPTGETKRELNVDPDKVAAAGKPTAAPKIPSAAPPQISSTPPPERADTPPPPAPAATPPAAGGTDADRASDAAPEPAAAGERHA